MQGKRPDFMLDPIQKARLRVYAKDEAAFHSIIDILQYASKTSSLAQEHMLFILLDPDGRILHFSALCEQTTGYTAEAVTGASLTDYVTDPAPVQELLDQKRFPAVVTITLKDQKGLRHDIQWYVEALSNDDGETDAMLMMGVADEQFWRQLVEDQIDMISRHRVDGEIIFANRAYRNYFGIALETLIGQRFRPLIPWPDRLLLQACRASLTFSNPVMTFEHQVWVKGELRWTQWTIRAIFDTHQHLVEYHSVGRDITEHRAAEEALRESEERFRHIAETVKDVFFVYNWRSNEILYLSPAFEDIWGLQVEPIYADADRLITTVHPDDVEHLLISFNQATEQGGDFDEEFRVVQPNGEVRWVWARATALQAQGGLLTGLVEDITARKEAEAALRRSEYRYRVISSLTSDYAFSARVDPDGGVSLEWLSDAFTRITGYSNDELRHSNSWTQLMHSDDIEHLQRTLHTLLHEPKTVQVEYRIITKAGEMRHMRTYAQPIWDQQQGRVVRVHGATQDITDRKGVEAALREAELRYRTVADFTYDWEYWINPDGTLRYVSPTCQRITGYTAQEFLDNPALLQSILMPEDVESWLNHSHSNPNAKGLREIQFRIRRRDGAVRWIEHACQPVTDNNGTFVGYRASNRDVTDRKHAEVALRESEQRFRAMADTAPVLIWMSGLDRKCFYFNKVWLDFTGRRHEEEVGDGWLEGVHPDDYANCVRTYHQAFEKREPFELEYRLRRHDGKYRWILDNATPRFLADGTFTGYIGSCIDITERKESEAERERLIGDLRTFGATVAHDLKNPVSSIIKIGQILQMISPAHEQYQEFVGYILECGETMRHIINSLLLLAGVREMSVERSPLDMRQIIKQALARLQHQIEASAAQITMPNQWPTARGYAPWIEEVWVNYLDNALQYGGNPPIIDIGATSTETGVRFWVRDNGDGIDAADQERLFGPFTRLNHAQQKGHGLGLSIVKSIVEKLDGQVGVESNPGAGSLFYFILPTD